jgi:tungstate transport system substrate-binding protein
LLLATTTSAQDSGLLESLAPRLLQERGIELKYVAVGTGQALEIGKRGDADVVLTHAPAAEREFLAAGHAESRAEVFWNDFLIVGPAGDPAAIGGTASAAAALAKIAGSQSRFVSRGDESGTHKVEMKLWKEAGLDPRGDWYISAGAGMAQVLRMAYELRGYTLVDRATWIAHRKGLDLVALVEGDAALVNQYSVLVINPARHSHLRVAEAREFAIWLQEPGTREFIADLGKDQYGEALFKVGSVENP